MFLLVLVWATLALYSYIPALKLNFAYWPILQDRVIELWRRGYPPNRFLPYCIVASILLLVFIYRGRYKIEITDEAVIVHSPLGEPRILRWVDVDEVYISRIRYPLEGAQHERRKLVLYARKRFWWLPWRSKLTMTNRAFEGYSEAQRLAVRIAVPAIAERLRLQLLREGGRVEFGKPSVWQDLFAVALFAVSAASVILAVRMWHTHLWGSCVLFAIVAIMGFLACLGRFRRQWYAVDPENLYVIRRGLPTVKIPLLWLKEANVSKGVMNLVAVNPHAQHRETTVRDKRFFRNRGVMLALIRLLVSDASMKAYYTKRESSSARKGEEDLPAPIAQNEEASMPKPSSGVSMPEAPSDTNESLAGGEEIDA